MIPERLDWLTTGAPNELARLFTSAGHEIYLVGGSVRDALLGRASPDLDFTTDARPSQIKSLIGSWADDLYTMGEHYGTIGALKRGERYEITTFRAEVYVQDSRKPDVTFGDSIEDDLERRDFTVNAMALQLGIDEPELIDPHDGVVDVATKTLRTPIGPDISFSEDPLRMLRLFRFVAELEFHPNADELEAVAAMSERLDIVSAERIRDEFSRLVVGVWAAQALQLLVDSGLADRFIPEVPALAMEQDPFHHHKDVLGHSIAVMAKTDADLLLRLAGLFHDIGKPATRKYEGSRVTFHHHEVVGARMTRTRMRALRYPKETIDAVAELVFLHMRPHTFKMGWTDSAIRRYVRDAGDLLPRLNQLVRCDVTTGNEKRARQIQRRIDELEVRIEELAELEELNAMRAPIDGNDVMSYLDIAPGPRIGIIMDLLLEKRIDDGPYKPAEAYEVVRQWAIENGIDDPGQEPQ